MILLLLLFADSITIEQAAAAVRASHNNPTFQAAELCLDKAKSYPQLILVRRKLSEKGDCGFLEDILEVRNGNAVSVKTGGFSWPEATVEKQWNAGSQAEREQILLRWVLEIEWATNGVLAEAPKGFRKKFTPPRAFTDKKGMHVEAWLTEQALYADTVCFAKHRRTIKGTFWSEKTQVEVDCHPK